MLPFDHVVEGWAQREVPLRLIRSQAKLQGIFGSLAQDATGYLEDLHAHWHDAFPLLDKLAHISQLINTGATPLMAGGLTICLIVTPKEAVPYLRTKAQAPAYKCFREAFVSAAKGSQLAAEFMELALKPVLDVFEGRLHILYTQQGVSRHIAALAARNVREALILECWGALHALRHPIAKASRELRQVGGVPLWVEPGNITTVLVAKPPSP